jgi:hypothetical protein
VKNRTIGWCFLCLLLCFTTCWAQSQNSSISGQVTDPSGAVIVGAVVTVTSAERQSTGKVTTAADGRYSFPNLEPGAYELQVEAAGFRTFVQRGITLVANQTVRIDPGLQVGEARQTVEVEANASPLNFDNAVLQEGVSPETINQLPLLVAGQPRNSAEFIAFLPGVNSGTGSEGFNARVNGGLQMGDEAVMDGVSMQEGTMSQSGMVAFFDYRMTPDMVSEVRVLTSNYEPEYGTSTGAQIIATTKSGTKDFHGAAYEYLRNKAFNATQFTIDRQPGDQRPKDNEHEFGFALGGPAKLPWINSGNRRTFFFTDWEFFRIAGGASRPTLSIPSLAERQGDFSDWKDANGNLIPVFNPATTRANPAYDPNQPAGPSNLKYLRDQFMGCDGQHPNVICPSQITNSLAQQWFKYLPDPTSSGALNNYLVPQPVPDTILAGANHWLVKIDHYLGDKDHFTGTIWRQKTPIKFACTLPQQLCDTNFSHPQDTWILRYNWDHTFSPTVLNHFAYGYLNRNEGYGSIDYKYVNDLPQIAGAFSHNYPPRINFSDGFNSFGDNSGLAQGNKTTRPSHIANDLVTWVRGAHTIKIGGEYRHLAQVFNTNGNESGTFSFDRGATGLSEIPSGNPIASFLLGAVDNANVQVNNIAKSGANQRAYALHAGDTWKITPKLSLTLGIRWDKFSPAWETKNQMSFFDFGLNPTAGNLPGRLVFAGNKWGDASAGVRYPEKDWNKGFVPRIGVAFSPTDKTVIRTGYGIFYTQAFYPGWGGGMSLDGFNPNPSFHSTVGGIQPAFYLQDGFPSYPQASDISVGAKNGQSPMYRPKDANRLSYSQQWNFTIERRLGNQFMVSAGYVASKGTRLPSALLPLNVLNPSLLSMGNALTDEFGPNDTVVNGVQAPYASWATQLRNAGCDPTVAQALVPFPQYCGSLTGLNENLGSSTYHSLQLKAEKRYSNGVYLLASYTWSKMLTDAAGSTQSAQSGYGRIGNMINPFEKSRNKAISPDDVPHNFSLMGVYALPFGRGKMLLKQGGWIEKLAGGWTISSTIKLTSGFPFFFDSGTCNVPGQFRAACLPGVLGGKNPILQSFGSFDPAKPMFDVNAFEPVSNFNYYWGVGQRVTNYRGSGYKGQDVALAKNINLTEKLKLEFRGEAFNIWNAHYLTCDGQLGSDCMPFNNDISSADFGKWNGTVSKPRNIQLVGRFTF